MCGDGSDSQPRNLGASGSVEDRVMSSHEVREHEPRRPKTSVRTALEWIAVNDLAPDDMTDNISDAEYECQPA